MPDNIEHNTGNKARIARFLNQTTTLLRHLSDHAKLPAERLGYETLLVETAFLAEHLGIERNDAEDRDHYIPGRSE